MRRTFLGFIIMGLLGNMLLAGCQQAGNEKAEPVQNPAPQVTPNSVATEQTSSTPPADSTQIVQNQEEGKKRLELIGLSKPLPNGKVEEDFQVGQEEGGFLTDEGNTLSMIKKPVLDMLRANHEALSNFSLPQYESMFFFSTSSDASVKPSDNVNRMYLYDQKAGEVYLLYEEKNERLLRLIGRDGSKLIIFSDFFDNSPGPCGSVWLMADKKSPMLALELTNLQAGLTPYTIPASEIEAAKKEEQQCRKENGFSDETSTEGL